MIFLKAMTSSRAIAQQEVVVCVKLFDYWATYYIISVGVVHNLGILWLRATGYGVLLDAILMFVDRLSRCTIRWTKTYIFHSTIAWVLANEIVRISCILNSVSGSDFHLEDEVNFMGGVFIGTRKFMF